MGKLRQFRQGYRKINGMTIFWISKQMTQVSDSSGMAIVFHRWFNHKNYAHGWKLFNEYLRRNNKISTCWEVMQRAREYDIDMQAPYKVREIPPDAIEYVSIFEGKVL